VEIKYNKTGEVNILSPQDKLDIITSVEFEEMLSSLIEKGEKKFLIDFSGLQYISSAGLRVVILTAKKLKQVNGIIHLCSMQKQVNDVFNITGLFKIFQYYSSVDEALKNF
jgi:anti-anti-sigma factor